MAENRTNVVPSITFNICTNKNGFGSNKKRTNDKTVIQYKFSDMLNLISVNRDPEAKDIQMKNELHSRQGWGSKSRQSGIAE